MTTCDLTITKQNAEECNQPLSLCFVVSSDCTVSVNEVHSDKLKFHWDQFPRNFPEANVTGKSPTSYEEVGHVANLLRGSYEEAGDFQTISTCQDGLATSPTAS